MVKTRKYRTFLAVALCVAILLVGCSSSDSGSSSDSEDNGPSDNEFNNPQDNNHITEPPEPEEEQKTPRVYDEPDYAYEPVTRWEFGPMTAEEDAAVMTNADGWDMGDDLTDEDFEQLEPMQYTLPEKDLPVATIRTSMGEIQVVLFPDQAPLAVNNFITHAKEGYYDGLTFHRVMEQFMIQGGDPLGNGTGGDSVYTNTDGDPIPFQDEPSLYLVHFRGALSMANAGSNTNGSQFFIVQAEESTYPVEMLEQLGYPQSYIDKYEENGGTPHLDFQHTVFGMVIKGMKTVDDIAETPVDPNSKPLSDVIIESITIENA